MPILRDAPFGDIQPRKDLDSRDKIVVHPPRDLEHLLHQPVDSEPDNSNRVPGLDMNVAGLVDNGILENQLLNANHWREILAGDIQEFLAEYFR